MKEMVVVKMWVLLLVFMFPLGFKCSEIYVKCKEAFMQHIFGKDNWYSSMQQISIIS